jgi:hypothetical protein
MKSIIINSANRQPEAIQWKYPVKYNNIAFPPGIYTPANFPQTLTTVLNNIVPSTMPFDVQFNPVSLRITISNTITDFQFLFGETSMHKIAILCGFTLLESENSTDVYSQYIKGNTEAGSATLTTDDKLQFTLVTSFIAHIPLGFYTYHELSNKVEIAMNAATIGQSYTCGYNEISNQFIIYAAILPGISIYWDTPESSNLALLMGFRAINPPKVASIYHFMQMHISNSHISQQLPTQLSHFRYNFYSIVKATKMSIRNLSLLSSDLAKMYNVNNETNTLVINTTIHNLLTYKLIIPNGTYTPTEYCTAATNIINNSITFTYDSKRQKITIVCAPSSLIGVSFPNKKTAQMLGFNFDNITPTTNTIISHMCVAFNYPRFIHFGIKYGINNDISLKTTLSMDEQQPQQPRDFIVDVPFEANSIFIELTDENNNYIPIFGNWTALFELYS